MSNLHQERPGKGVAYWETEEMRVTKDGAYNDKHPDWKGFVVLEMDYKAGEKLKLAIWKKPTSRGVDLLSLSEDNWSKKQREQHKEVQPNYQRENRHPASIRKFEKRVDDDNSVPF